MAMYELDCCPSFAYVGGDMVSPSHHDRPNPCSLLAEHFQFL